MGRGAVVLPSVLRQPMGSRVEPPPPRPHRHPGPRRARQRADEDSLFDPLSLTRGYDIYARCIYGARASILVGLMTTNAVVLVGGAIGVFAGYKGGWVDSLLSRIGDVFFAIPLLLGAIIMLVSLPRTTNYWFIIIKVVLALMVLGWPSIARHLDRSMTRRWPRSNARCSLPRCARPRATSCAPPSCWGSTAIPCESD